MTSQWDIVFVDKETREVKIVDMADTQVKQKELDKMEKYHGDYGIVEKSVWSQL